MPSGKTAYPKIEDNRDGTVTVRYQPTETGLHELHVKYNNESIEGEDGGTSPSKVGRGGRGSQHPGFFWGGWVGGMGQGGGGSLGFSRFPGPFFLSAFLHRRGGICDCDGLFGVIKIPRALFSFFFLRSSIGGVAYATVFHSPAT